MRTRPLRKPPSHSCRALVVELASTSQYVLPDETSNSSVHFPLDSPGATRCASPRSVHRVPGANDPVGPLAAG